MGSKFSSEIVDGRLSTLQVQQRWYEDLCCLSADQKPDDDAVGYASCSELCFSEAVFQEEDAALQWLDDNTEKWGAALVVRAKTTVTELQKPATLATPEELAGADKI